MKRDNDDGDRREVGRAVDGDASRAVLEDSSGRADMKAGVGGCAIVVAAVVGE